MREGRPSQKQLWGCRQSRCCGGGEWDGEDASRVCLWGQNQEVSLGSRQRGALGAMETINKPALRWS